MIKAVGIIPVRGGSKGIPRKNLKTISGKSLIEITCKNALGSELLDQVVISTEDKEIFDHSKTIKDVITIKRPSILAQDDTSTASVLIHAIQKLDELGFGKIDIVVLLQVTCPLRDKTIIDNCINHLLLNPQCDSLCTLVDVNGIHPIRMYTINNKSEIFPYTNSRDQEFAPRQKLKPVYVRSGDVYAIRTDILLKKNSLLGDTPHGIIINENDTCNIDTPIDFELAQILYKKKYN